MDGEDGGCEDRDVVMSVFLTGLPTLYQDYHQGSLFPPNPLLSMYCKKYNIVQTKTKNQAEFIIIFPFLPSSNVFPLNLKRVNVSPPNRPPCCQWQKTESRDLSSDSPVPISVALNKDLSQFTWMDNKLSYKAQKSKSATKKEATTPKFSYNVSQIQFPVGWEKICNITSHF